MKDVAKLADVSTATVSRYFTDPDAVSDLTRKKVMKAVEELDYAPNILARNLRKMETDVILVIVPDITNPFFSKVLRGISDLALKRGYKVLLGDTKNDPELEKEYLKSLEQKYARGLITLTARTNAEILTKLAQKIDIVLACEYIKGLDLPTVSIDNPESAYRATKYLLKLGHQKIAHLAGPEGVILSQDRLSGYQKALKEAGIEIKAEYILEGDFTFDSGFKLMQQILKLKNLPTAVFASNDEMAIGAIKAIKKADLKVPDDISVMGFDDIKISSIYEPELTTIRQPMYQIGEQAIKLLLDLINNREIEKKNYILQSQIIERESCQKIK